MEHATTKPAWMLDDFKPMSEYGKLLFNDDQVFGILGQNPASEWNFIDIDKSIGDNISTAMWITLRSLSIDPTVSAIFFNNCNFQDDGGVVEWSEFFDMLVSSQMGAVKDPHKSNVTRLVEILRDTANQLEALSHECDCD